MADATAILAAVKDALSEAFPKLPVKTSKRKAAGGQQGQGGLAAGYPTHGFVISCGDPEQVDRVPTFERISLGYVVTVEYLKPAQAKVEGADDGPPTVVEDPDVREKRDAIRAALFKVLAAVPGCFDTRNKSSPVYDTTAEGKAVVLVSGEEFTFTVHTPRP